MAATLSNVEIDRRVKALAQRVRTAEGRAAPTVKVRRLRPEPAPVASLRCVRCGGIIDGQPHLTPAGAWHDECKPAPAPAPPRLVVVPDEAVVRDTRPHHGIRRTHLPAGDRVRVLDWLAENGPATARTIAWALDVDRREVTLLLRSLDGSRVEEAGTLVTGRRGHPPTVWQIRAAMAA